MIERLSGRRVCSNGHVYHVEFDPPKHDGVCDQDGKPLDPARRRRARDDQEAARDLPRADRAAEDYYDERGLLRRFDGTRDVTEVHDHIRATLATLRLEERLWC